MSMPQRHEIECPDCGLRQSITYWGSINVTVDPELLTFREALYEHCQRSA